MKCCIKIINLSLGADRYENSVKEATDSVSRTLIGSQFHVELFVSNFDKNILFWRKLREVAKPPSSLDGSLVWKWIYCKLMPAFICLNTEEPISGYYFIWETIKFDKSPLHNLASKMNVGEILWNVIVTC